MAASDNIIGANITAKRIGRGWTQQKLAEEIGSGMTQPYIATLESGKVKPTRQTLEKIAKVFKIKPEALQVRTNEINYSEEIVKLLPTLQHHQQRILFLVAEEMTRHR